MNDDQHNTDSSERIDRDRQHADRAEKPERAGESEASAPARHRDPSLTKTPEGEKTGTSKPERPGVEWVRPSDLIASRSARMAGRGIDFQAELSRRARRVPGQAYRATRTGVRTGTRLVSERARKLPPVTAFGRGSGERFSWVSRSGIGLG